MNITAKVLAASLIMMILLWLASCEKGPPTFGGDRLVTTMVQLFEDPNRYLGYLVVADGKLEKHGDLLIMTDFQMRVDYVVPEDAELIIVDSTPGRWLVKEGELLEPQCVGRMVSVMGTVGRVSSLGKIGIVEIESIYIRATPADTRAMTLCYTAEDPAYYKPIPISSGATDDAT